MIVSAAGIRDDGSSGRATWQLIAGSNHGPEIPCMAAILMAHKIARGGVSARGAFPCMGFLSLDEYEPEFARWDMTSVIEESGV
jgi:hypothetical protein